MNNPTLLSTRELERLQSEFEGPTNMTEALVLHGVRLELKLRELAQSRFVMLEELKADQIDLQNDEEFVDDNSDELLSRVEACLE